MNISYVHGICLQHDAISNSIRDEIEWLSPAHNVRLFAYACDQPQLPFTKVESLNNLIFDAHFRASELVVFHFGVHYPLFDALTVCPVQARRLVVFHNITPKEFVAPGHHGTADLSFRQLANLVFANHVVCDSQTNLDAMRAAGIDTPATVLPLALHSHHEPPPAKPSARDGLVRIAFVGRFVKSKGAGELVTALDQVLRAAPGRRIALDMVGNLKFSDPLLLDEIGKAIDLLHQAHGARVRVTIHGSAPEERKASLLRDADLFVLPTWHEGFCVPVLEALASGCKVISYDNSNLPAITGGLGQLVPTGDVAALAAAIADAAALVTSPAWRESGYGEYAAQAGDYVSAFSPERTRLRFVKFIRHFTH